MHKKVRLGILFGGRSGEHEVSLTSAASLLQALDPDKYEVIPIGITRQGRWMAGTAADRLLPEVLEHGRPVAASADPNRPMLVPVDTVLPEHSAPQRANAEIDVVFP